MISLAVLTEYRRVTDRGTDRQTSCNGIVHIAWQRCNIFVLTMPPPGRGHHPVIYIFWKLNRVNFWRLSYSPVIKTTSMKFWQTWLQWSVTDLWELVGCDDEIVGLSRTRRIYHRPTKVWCIRRRKVASQTWYQSESSTNTLSTISALSPRTTDSPPTQYNDNQHAVNNIGSLTSYNR